MVPFGVTGHTFNGTDCPELASILLGRGKPIMRHPGNFLLRDLIEQRLEEYESASKQGKTQITWELMNHLKSVVKIRFLKQDKTSKGGWWVEATDEEARQKVSVGFRDIRKSRQNAIPTVAAASSAMTSTNAAATSSPTAQEITTTTKTNDDSSNC
jgi:hypothetical protein